jgi:hypothetical protein
VGGERRRGAIRDIEVFVYQKDTLSYTVFPSKSGTRRPSGEVNAFSHPGKRISNRRKNDYYSPGKKHVMEE